MAEPSLGPYVVEAQKSFSSLALKDPETGELVDKGANIPMDQILAGPYRSILSFKGSPGDSDDDVRGIGQMLRREGAPPELAPITPHRGAAAPVLAPVTCAVKRSFVSGADTRPRSPSTWQPILPVTRCLETAFSPDQLTPARA